ncbi:hypothetical protein IAG44_20155 [Streptomyces roseirectus]|uniref:Uncharacterized protein n=1 Tax=Streptomyces roseirectus TaxID=2768066 RepID=A0A7H0ISV1_9ACTN|nr:hypothetical protein IAG44_20155 [Streptomyces roseirectus]
MLLSPEGRTRTCVFQLLGTVLGYATQHLDARRLGEVAVVGPLTPGVDVSRLWQLAAAMNKATATATDQAMWIMMQAHRAFVCGDLLARWEEAGWKLEPGGRRVAFGGLYCNRYELWTGNLTVEGTTPDMVAPKPSVYPV